MKNLVIFLVVGGLIACTPIPPEEQGTKLTAGIVQKEIHLDMPASDVAMALGSPNIVTLDENKDEVWVYDKLSTQVQYSSAGGGVWLILAGAHKESGRSETNQRTLTVVVKFDQEKKVKDFTYRQSSF